MQKDDIAIVRCPMNFANRQLQNEVVKVLKIWDLGNMADVRILSGAHKGERWQFVLSHLRKRRPTKRALDGALCACPPPPPFSDGNPSLCIICGKSRRQ